MYKTFKEALRKEKGASVLIVALAAVVFVVVFMAMITVITGLQYNVLSASSYLMGKGYVVLAAGEYTTLYDKIDELNTEFQHASYIFPEATNETVTINAHANANTWSDWQEFTDNDAHLFSDKITSPTHLSDTKIEYYSDKNFTYMYQIAYGDSKTIVASRRVSPIKESGEYSNDLRSNLIPVGERVYARVMCSTGGASIEILLRYHYH